MSFHPTLLLFTLLSMLLSVALAAEEPEVNAVDYNEENFNKHVAEENHFVMFFAPWCGHCKRLHPTWEDLAKKYNQQEEKEAVIAKVDCTQETALCSEQGVTGYPTLKFFKKGESEAEKYKGPRDLANLEKFVGKKLGLIEEEESKEESDTPVLDKGLYILGEKSFANHIKSGDHFIKFYAPWCGHCQKLAPVWDELAENFQDGKTAKIAKLDCTTAQSICQEHGVKGYPTLAYFRDGKKLETYKGARTLNELKDFVKSIQEEKKQSSGDSDKVPTEKSTNVVLVQKEEFRDNIKSGLTFVKFYAPWCGHCKRLAPVWETLADKFADNENVKIAKVDCTSNDHFNKELCNEEGVSGFPTLYLYKDSVRISEFQGRREIEDLTAFIEKYSGEGDDEEKTKKDEL